MSGYYVIGVDPGKDGAAVMLDSERRVVAVVDGSKEVHVAASEDKSPHLAMVDGIIAAVRAMNKRAGLCSVVAFVERQHIRAGEGGGGDQLIEMGAWASILRAHGAIVEVIEPSLWRKRTGTARGNYAANKAASVAYCTGRLPDLDLTPGRRRKPHTGIADAGVIACYGLGLVRDA